MTMPPTQQIQPIPWLMDGGFFYADLNVEESPQAAAKAMRADVAEYWDEWTVKKDEYYKQLVPTWWSDKRQRLDHYYRKSQAGPDPATGMTPWQVQALFYPAGFAEDQADFLKLREMEAAGKL